MKIKTLLQYLDHIPGSTKIMDIYGDNIGVKFDPYRTKGDKSDVFLITRPYRKGYLTADDIKRDLSFPHPDCQLAFPSGRRMYMTWLKQPEDNTYVLELCGIQDISRSRFLSIENYLRNYFKDEERFGTDRPAAYKKLGEMGFLLRDLQESSFYTEAAEMEEKYHWQDQPDLTEKQLSATKDRSYDFHAVSERAGELPDPEEIEEPER